MRLSVRFWSGVPVELSALIILTALAGGLLADEVAIPLPEHPRPDLQRPDWINLNGIWKFRFDGDDVGTAQKWWQHTATFDRRITVPFPWGAPLSGVSDDGDIGWYSRMVRVPADWKGKRIFLVIGACDWHTTAWLDDECLGTHRGGYTPFEFELTGHVVPGDSQRLVLRVDDAKRPFMLEGKQGYGPARGVWQTPYLEARGATPIRSIRCVPDIGKKGVTITAELREKAPRDLSLTITFKNARVPVTTAPCPEGAESVTAIVAIPRARLWTLEDPHLYEFALELRGGKGVPDRVASYFGMRSIGTGVLPGTDHRYITLNGTPVYLQTALDQAYHPEGFYTFPSDAFMRDEILRSRRIGLNGMRIHVKIGIPRKLYWADRLGMLIMADVPNSWGQPDAEMRREAEYALRQMIRRDFNHPAIFSWVIFNETWGLRTKGKGYTSETQEWVARMYRLAKELDPTRLVEDNSPCHYDHVVTDINSWHAYLPGYAWDARLDEFCAKTFPGSTWNYIGGRTQRSEPNFNSECGNVWGYEGSTGDVDWSWDYHRMIDAFRRHPKVCGWLYTEHHDVINEWNGYWRYDRSEKYTGLDALVEGMSLRDLHAPYYIAVGDRLSKDVECGATLKVPVWASVMCDLGVPQERCTLRTRLYGWDTLGRYREWGKGRRAVRVKSWMSEALEPLEVTMPDEPGLVILATMLDDASGTVLQRNFTTFVVSASGEAQPDEKLRTIRVAPKQFSDAKWSVKQWDVLDGLKVNGAGAGYFEYRVPWPEDLDVRRIRSAAFLVEASAKQLFGKDQKGAAKMEGDYMRGKGTLDPSRNPNSYPMTDTHCTPSAVRVRVNGTVAGVFDLPDDPADHRGILSWHSQVQDRTLKEAGSYGYMLEARIPQAVLRRAAKSGELVIRLEVDEALPGGVAVYGRRFGRYPLDPTVILALK